ncbi:bamE [Acrasis kona]|uniref:BamE n=1 Tax=Acrasis kona TaxID=1008807 RepID=A0AAW2ZL85_9EUKA
MSTATTLVPTTEPTKTLYVPGATVPVQEITVGHIVPLPTPKFGLPLKISFAASTFMIAVFNIVVLVLQARIIYEWMNIGYYISQDRSIVDGLVWKRDVNRIIPKFAMFGLATSSCSLILTPLFVVALFMNPGRIAMFKVVSVCSLIATIVLAMAQTFVFAGPISYLPAKVGFVQWFYPLSLSITLVSYTLLAIGIMYRMNVVRKNYLSYDQLQ